MLEEMAHPIVKLKTGINEMSANAKAFVTTPTQEVFAKLLGAKQTINQAITVYCELEMVKENKAVHEFLNTNQKAISDLVESIVRKGAGEPQQNAVGQSQRPGDPASHGQALRRLQEE